MAKIIVSSAALNVALNVLLIPRIGLQGAAVATLVSYVVFLALIAWASYAVLPLRVNTWACLRYTGAALISALLASRAQCSSEVLNLVVRGSLSVLIYGVVLLGIDTRFRLMTVKAIGYAVSFTREPGNVSELATAPAVEVGSKST